MDDLQPLRVLVVDDEETIRRSLARFFERYGTIVHQAADGAEALRMISEDEFDVIVSDLRMPGLDGAALWQRAVQARPHLRDRWVFVSAHMLPDELTGKNLVHVQKPFEVSTVLGAVWAVAARSQRDPAPRGPGQ